MSDLRTAAQQALEALIWTTGSNDFSPEGQAREGALKLLFPAITALRAALEQQAEPVQEPVAWMVYIEDGKSVCVTDNPNDLVGAYRALPIYTAPPQRKPLSGLEVERLLEQVIGSLPAARNLVRAVERAYGIVTCGDTKERA